MINVERELYQSCLTSIGIFNAIYLHARVKDPYKTPSLSESVTKYTKGLAALLPLLLYSV